MTGVRVLAAIALVLFTAFSVEVLWQFGARGFLDWALYNGATTLTFVDLALALTMVMVMMVRDARRRDVTVWPFLLLTVALGSTGPLLYFTLRPGSTAARTESGVQR
jgi:hypothetical protein